MVDAETVATSETMASAAKSAVSEKRRVRRMLPSLVQVRSPLAGPPWPAGGRQPSASHPPASSRARRSARRTLHRLDVQDHVGPHLARGGQPKARAGPAAEAEPALVLP